MKDKRLLVGLGVFLLFIAFPAFLAWNFLVAPVMDASDQFKGLLGKTEAELIAVLGQPAYRETPEQVKLHGIDFPWRSNGYEPLPERPVHKEVLLFDRSQPNKTQFGLYVFIGDNGRVEAVDPAGR
jgi:hypothetical protein